MAIQGGPKINQDGLVLWVDTASPRSFSGEPVVNLINTSSLSAVRYNNPGFSGSLVTTNQTFKGAPVYEGTFFASASSFIPRLGSTEGFGLFYQTPGYSASTYYVASVYFRTDYPIPTSSTQGFNHTYANIGPFGVSGTGTTRYTEGEWIRLYTQFYANTNGYATRTITYPGQYGIGMTYVVNTTSTQNVDVVLTVSASANQVPDFSTLYAIVSAAPSILANGGLTGLSIVDHGLDTTTFTKLSYPSNIKLKANLPFDYYIRLSVPSTSGVDTTIRLGSNFSTYLDVITDGKYWKVTFDTGSLISLPLDYPIKTYWAAPMMEIKTGSITYPSAFTFGTRGGTKQTGGGWLDLTTNNYSGSIVGSASFDSSSIGGALTFNGLNQYVTFGNILDMSTNDFTLDAWVKSTSTSAGNNNGIIYKRPTAYDTSSGYRLSMPNGAFNFHIADDVTSTSLTAGSGYNDGRWKNVTAVARRGNQLELYVNGSLIGSASSTFTTSITSSVNFAIGALNTGGSSISHAFTGSIATVKVYNRALSESEIIDNYDSLRTRFRV